MEKVGQIYQLIGQAIGKIGAIGKDKTNAQQGFKYRGIDQVYNALNPVMAELGIFFCPEVLEQKREERVNQKGTVITYTILTIRFTAYAPDGSSVSLTVVGEGMDTGDKSSNKAMSVAMKYAMFQLFCIPTEEMKDPDADVYDDILPRGKQPVRQAASPAPAPQPAGPEGGTVAKAATVPQAAKPSQAPAPVPTQAQKPETAGGYIKRKIAEMKQKDPAFDFMKARAALIADGVIEDIPSATMKMEQAQAMISAIEANFLKAS